MSSPVLEVEPQTTYSMSSTRVSHIAKTRRRDEKLYPINQRYFLGGWESNEVTGAHCWWQCLVIQAWKVIGHEFSAIFLSLNTMLRRASIMWYTGTALPPCTFTNSSCVCRQWHQSPCHVFTRQLCLWWTSDLSTKRNRPNLANSNMFTGFGCMVSLSDRLGEIQNARFLWKLFKRWMDVLSDTRTLSSENITIRIHQWELSVWLRGILVKYITIQHFAREFIHVKKPIVICPM